MTKPEGLSRESVLAKADFKVETSGSLYPSISYRHLALGAARQADLLQAVKGKPCINTYIWIHHLKYERRPFCWAVSISTNDGPVANELALWSRARKSAPGNSLSFPFFQTFCRKVPNERKVQAHIIAVIAVATVSKKNLKADLY